MKRSFKRVLIFITQASLCLFLAKFVSSPQASARPTGGCADDCSNTAFDCETGCNDNSGLTPEERAECLSDCETDSSDCIGTCSDGGGNLPNHACVMQCDIQFNRASANAQTEAALNTAELNYSECFEGCVGAE